MYVYRLITMAVLGVLAGILAYLFDKDSTGDRGIILGYLVVFVVFIIVVMGIGTIIQFIFFK